MKALLTKMPFCMLISTVVWPCVSKLRFCQQLSTYSLFFSAFVLVHEWINGHVLFFLLVIEHHGVALQGSAGTPEFETFVVCSRFPKTYYVYLYQTKFFGPKAKTTFRVHSACGEWSREGSGTESRGQLTPHTATSSCLYSCQVVIYERPAFEEVKIQSSAQTGSVTVSLGNWQFPVYM